MPGARGEGNKKEKTDLAALEQAGPCLSASVFQANRTQSLSYGCIVENPQTHEVSAEEAGWVPLLCALILPLIGLQTVLEPCGVGPSLVRQAAHALSASSLSL